MNSLRRLLGKSTDEGDDEMNQLSRRRHGQGSSTDGVQHIEKSVGDSETCSGDDKLSELRKGDIDVVSQSPDEQTVVTESTDTTGTGTKSDSSSISSASRGITTLL